MADFTLRIELAGTLGDVVAGGLVRSGIDAGALACRLDGRAIGGADERAAA